MYPQASCLVWPRLELFRQSSGFVFCFGYSCTVTGVTGVFSVFLLLGLVLSPHLLSAHLVLVVQRSSAVGTLLLLIVHLSRRVDGVTAVSVAVLVLGRLAVRSQTSVRRLPAHGLTHVRAVGRATGVLLSVGSCCGLKYLRRVVARRRVRREGRTLRRAVNGHLVLCRRA